MKPYLTGVDVELPIGLGALGGQARQQHVGPNARARGDARGRLDLGAQLSHNPVRAAQPGDVHEGLIARDGLDAAAPLHQEPVHLSQALTPSEVMLQRQSQHAHSQAANGIIPKLVKAFGGGLLQLSAQQ